MEDSQLSSSPDSWPECAPTSAPTFELAMTSPQKGMVIDSLRREEIDPYQLFVRIDLERSPAAEDVERGFRAVLGRNTHLNGRLDLARGALDWIIEPAAVLPSRQIDLCTLPAEQEVDALAREIDRERAAPLDLQRAPLMRLTIVQRHHRRCSLLWTFHHALLDTRGIVEFLKEAFAELDGTGAESMKGREPALLIQRALEADGRGGLPRSCEFWRGYLQGLSEPVSLPVQSGGAAREDHHEPGRYDYRRICLRELDEGDVAPLRALAAVHGLSSSAMVQAAWGVVLASHERMDDVVFGATRACRRAGDADLSRLIGITLNTVPVRVRVEPDMTLLDLIRRQQAGWQAMREHQWTSLSGIRGVSELPREAEFFDTLVNFDVDVNVQMREHSGAWRERQIYVYSDTPYPWVLTVLQREMGWLLRVSYDPTRFESRFVSRVLGHLEQVLRTMVSAPETRLGALDILTAEERADLTRMTQGDRSVPISMEPPVRRFEAQVTKSPHAPALRFGGQTWTYQELDEQAEALARCLRVHSSGPDTLVGLCLGRTPRLVAAMLAVHKAGAAYVPLDPNYPRERLRAILGESRLGLLIVDEAGRRVLPDDMEGILQIDVENGASGPGTPPAARGVEPHHLSHVIYTSGSTGVPKGVAIEHRSVSALLDWAARAFSQHELGGVLFSTSMCFDLSVFEVFVPLSEGGAIILAENALVLPELPERDEVTLLNTVPSAAAELVRMKGIPRSVQTINLAGEALKGDLVQTLYANTHADRIYNLYGPTEDTTYSTWALVARCDAREPTIGRPLDHTDAYVLDAHRRPVPVGVHGELYLGGAGLARGYLHRGDLTTERFIEVHVNGGLRRLYRTGDRASFGLDGEIRYHGRLDYQVKLRGFRIELGEIEAHLERHPEVRHAIVMVTGEGAGQSLVAWVATDSSLAVTEDALRRLLEGCLPGYMVPSRFVVMENFPQTANGKVDRKRLPPPGTGTNTTENDEVPPAGVIEQLLLSLWSEVLGSAISSIRRSFFELGGNSLLLVQVAVLLKSRHGRAVSMTELLRYPTIERLAAHLRGSEASPARATLATQQAGPGSAARLRGIIGGSTRGAGTHQR